MDKQVLACEHVFRSLVVYGTKYYRRNNKDTSPPVAVDLLLDLGLRRFVLSK